MYRLNITISFFIALSYALAGQGSFHLNGNTSKKIDFELIGNLMVVPVKVNNTQLSFVLDTGVSKPILFNIAETDSGGLRNTDTFYLYGLGGNGKLEALKSSGNLITIGDVNLFNRDLYVVYDKDINFTPRLGVLVHGNIGYDIFKDFIVEINYSSKFIRLHKPESFKQLSNKKWQAQNIEIHKNKPYLNIEVVIEKFPIDVKLLIDTGSSDALWLFENREKGISPNENILFEDYLGRGLSGSVYGSRSKLKKATIGGHELVNVNVAFPDSVSLDTQRIYKERHGSIGGEVLKRFNHFYDYGNGALYLRKNGYFKDKFTYNNSGIVLEHNGIMLVREAISIPEPSRNRGSGSIKISQIMRYVTSIKPAFEIVEIRQSSNAYASGLRVGDVLVALNGKKAYEYKLPEINAILHGKPGTPLKVRIERYGLEMEFGFSLDDVFKKNKPSIGELKDN